MDGSEGSAAVGSNSKKKCVVQVFLSFSEWRGPSFHMGFQPSIDSEMIESIAAY